MHLLHTGGMHWDCHAHKPLILLPMTHQADHAACNHMHLHMQALKDTLSCKSGTTPRRHPP